MRVLAVVEPHQLAALARAGLTPERAVDALLAEAHRRYPDTAGIALQRSGDRFEIVAY